MGRRKGRTRYTVYVTPAAWEEIKSLPGVVKQRVRRAITALADEPSPAKSKALKVTGLECEVRRIRLEQWRIVYALSEADLIIDVLAVRKRPPYDYTDLMTLLQDYVEGSQEGPRDEEGDTSDEE